MRHEPGLASSPPVRYILEVEGVGTLLSTYRPLWADNLLAKRRRTAVRRPKRISYGPTDAAAERGSSSPSSARPARTSSRAPSVSRSSFPFADAVHLAILTHSNQYACGFRREALHGRPRRVERRVARKSADLRGGGHVSRTAASSAADLTESYAEDDTPWGMLRNDTLEPRNTRRRPHTVCRARLRLRTNPPATLVRGYLVANVPSRRIPATRLAVWSKV